MIRGGTTYFGLKCCDKILTIKEDDIYDTELDSTIKFYDAH